MRYWGGEELDGEKAETLFDIPTQWSSLTLFSLGCYEIPETSSYDSENWRVYNTSTTVFFVLRKMGRRSHLTWQNNY